MKNTKTVKKQIYKWSRTLHIYVSAALFALLIMFCVTGITLNHADWFSDDYREDDVNMNLSAGLVSQINTAWDTQADMPIQAVVAEVKQKYPKLPKPSSSNLDYELQELTLDYKLPAGYANAVIMGDEAMMSYREGGFFSLINDLHKGRHTGTTWRWVIDISAVLMLVFSITGLVLMIQNKKRRKAGLWVTLAGIATPVLLYWFFVPQI